MNFKLNPSAPIALTCLGYRLFYLHGKQVIRQRCRLRLIREHQERHIRGTASQHLFVFGMRLSGIRFAQSSQ